MNQKDMRRMARLEAGIRELRATQERRAASPMPLSEVDPKVLSALRPLKLRPIEAWDGIHGIIVTLEQKGPMGPRFTAGHLQTLLRVPGFRWVETDQNSVSVGV
jgi:hypothetical protein